jgi:DsbC/DsbD-like thiol-disulfide interchange protein
MRPVSVLALALIAAVFMAAGVDLNTHSNAGSNVCATQDNSSLPPAASVVKTHSFVSLEPVPAGKQFQLAIVVDIARGFHMNSHKPTDPYLIPTTLTPDLPASLQLVDAIYPEGTLEKFAFSPDKALSVYTKSVVLALTIKALPNAHPGSATIPISLRYQACNDSSCLPPVKVPVTATVEIAAPGAASHAAHPEIFSHLAPAK